MYERLLLSFKSTKKYPLTLAIEALKMAVHVGLDGLKIFTLTREPPHILAGDDYLTYESVDEFVESLSTACWSGADFYRMWLGDENVNLNQYEINTINDADLRHFENGVYYMAFLGSESHYWVWVIDDYSIWYAGTYGGVCHLTLKQFERRIYEIMWKEMLLGDLDAYDYVFQVKNQLNRVNYQSITVTKSLKYE